MAIPASVTLYTNWGLGSLVSTTYTQAAPEIPNAHTWTFKGTIEEYAGTPWNGQYLSHFDSVGMAHGAQTTLSSSTAHATSGRILIEINAFPTNARTLFNLAATNASNGTLTAARNGSGNLNLSLSYGGGDYVALDAGAFPTPPFALEIIYDTNNATAAQRLQKRTWSIGGTPGSFTTANDTEWAGSPTTTDQWTALGLAEMDNNETNSIFGRVILSNSTTEDLSAVTETESTPIPVFAYHYQHH